MLVETDVNGNGRSSDSIKWFTVSKIRKWKNSDPRKWRYWDVETTSPGLLQHDNSFCWITAFFFKEDWKLLFLVDQKNSGCMPVTLEAQEHVYLFVCFFHESIVEHPGHSSILLKGRWLTDLPWLLSHLSSHNRDTSGKPAFHEWVRKTFLRMWCQRKTEANVQIYLKLLKDQRYSSIFKAE